MQKSQDAHKNLLCYRSNTRCSLTAYLYMTDLAMIDMLKNEF